MSEIKPTPSSPEDESTDLGTRRSPGGRPGTYPLRSDRVPREPKHRLVPGRVTVAQLLSIHRPRVKPLPSSAATLKPAVA